MSTAAIPEKSKAEREAIFAQLFAGTVPAEPPNVSLKAQIRAYRAEILAYHAKGYSWRQIQEKIKQPPLNLDASVSTLLKTVLLKPKKKARTLPLVQLPARGANPGGTGTVAG